MLNNEIKNFLHKKNLSTVVATFIVAVLFSGCSFDATVSSSSLGDPVVLEQAEEVVETTSLEPVFTIDTAVWRFLEGSAAIDVLSRSYESDSWLNLSYDDTAWGRGIGSFGAQDGGLGELSGGYYPSNLLGQYDSAGDNFPVYLLRTSFNLANVDQLGGLVADISYDDAVIVYVNGFEVFEGNVPEGGYPTPDSFGSAEPSSVPFTAEFEIPIHVLQMDSNVISVELHQDNQDSSDIYFEFNSLTPKSIEFSEVNIGVGPTSDTVHMTYVVDGVIGVNSYIELIETTLVGAEPRIINVSDPTESAYGYSYRTMIDGLKPGTEYSYTIYSHGIEKSGMFVTGTAEDGVSALFTADPQFGAGDLSLIEQNGMYIDTVLNYDDNIDFMTVIGDVADDATDNDAYNSFFNALSLSHLPNSIVYGSNDITTTNLSDKIFTTDMQASGNYYYSYGDVLFIVLNSNEGDANSYSSFISQAIADHTTQYGEPSFKVLTLHHSLYSQGVNSTVNEIDIISSLRLELAPIISAQDIDLVVSANDHMYTRSNLMNSLGVSVATGSLAEIQKGIGDTMYVSLGSVSGNNYFDANPTLQPYTAVSAQPYEPMIGRLDVVDDALTFTVYNTSSNQVIDTFTLTK